MVPGSTIVPFCHIPPERDVAILGALLARYFAGANLLYKHFESFKQHMKIIQLAKSFLDWIFIEVDCTFRLDILSSV